MPIKNRKKTYSPSLLRNHIHGCRSELCQRPMQSCDVHIPEITREWNNDSSHQALDTACSSSGVILSSPQSRGTPVTLHVLRPCASPRFPVPFKTLAAHAGPLSCGYRLIHRYKPCVTPGKWPQWSCEDFASSQWPSLVSSQALCVGSFSATFPLSYLAFRGRCGCNLNCLLKYGWPLC